MCAWLSWTWAGRVFKRREAGAGRLSAGRKKKWRWGIRGIVLLVVLGALYEAGTWLEARSRRMVVEVAVDAARRDLVGREFPLDSGSFTLSSLESRGWQGRELHLLARGSGKRRILLLEQQFRFTVLVVLVPRVSVGILETTAQVTGTCRRVRVERKRLVRFLADLTSVDEFIDRLAGEITRSELSALLERGYHIRYRYGGDLSVAQRAEK